MSDTISIIIPVYNVENYVAKCLDSVIGQTYRNLEILVIDDGSTDSSGKICDEYATKDPRIKVFHTANGGNTAIPRNVGLDNMSGDYVGFVDSDDWLEPDMYEHLYAAIEGVDVAVCPYFRDTPSHSEAVKNARKIRERVIPAEKMLTYPLMRDDYMGFCGYLWNKLFRASLFDGLRFDESIRFASDVLTFSELVASGNVKGAYIEKPLYHWTISRQGAITKSEDFRVRSDILRSYKGIEALLPAKDKYLARGFYCHHAGMICELAIKKRDRDMLKKMQGEIKAHYDDYRRTNRKFPEKFARMEGLLSAKLVNCREYDINRFAEQIGTRQIVCFGAYQQFSDWVAQNPDLVGRIAAIIDNNKALQGSVCKLAGRKLRIVSLDKFAKMKMANFVFLINTNRNIDPIVRQLDLSGQFGNVDVYVAELRQYSNDKVIRKAQLAELETLDEFVRVCDEHKLKYYLTGGTMLGAARHKGFIPWDDDIDVIMPKDDFEKFVHLPPQAFGEDFFLHWISTDKNCVEIAAHLRKRNTLRLEWAPGYESAGEEVCAIGVCIFRTLFSGKKYDGRKTPFEWFEWRFTDKLVRVAQQKYGRCLTAPRTVFALFSIPALLRINELATKMLFKSETGYWWGKSGNEVFGAGVPLEFEGRYYNAPTDWDYYLTVTYGRDYMQLPPPEKRFSHCPRALSFDVQGGVWEEL